VNSQLHKPAHKLPITEKINRRNGELSWLWRRITAIRLTWYTGWKQN